MSCTASSLMANAAANGYYGLQDRNLKEAILYMLCQNGAGAVAPGVVDPNGNVVGSPGQIYFNTATHTFWAKETGAQTDTGWVQYI